MKICKIKKTTTNKNGQTIVKCCASCKHKQPNDHKTRLCTLFGEKVEPDKDDCNRWEMSKHLDKVGDTLGRVKRASYLNWLIHQPQEYTLAECREEWERLNKKSIYLNKK